MIVTDRCQRCGRVIVQVTDRPGPRRYRLNPFYVDAVQWTPGDLEQAGACVGWLMALGVDVRHPSGQGDTTTLQIGDSEPARPGSWVVRNADGRVFTLPDEQFRASYTLTDETR